MGCDAVAFSLPIIKPPFLNIESLATFPTGKARSQYNYYTRRANRLFFRRVDFPGITVMVEANPADIINLEFLKKKLTTKEIYYIAPRLRY